MANPCRIEPLERIPAELAARFPDWDSHPLRGAFAERLYRTILGDTHRDSPFMVVGPDGPLVLARCTVGAGQAGFFGMPLVLACRADSGAKERRQGLAAALNHMTELAQAEGLESLHLAGVSAPDPDIVDCLCMDRSAQGSVQGSAVIDLSLEPDLLRRDIRDSYRSLVNWGSRNLRLAHVNRDSPDRGLFDVYADFHASIAGGKRRSEAYWNVYWDEILAGRAELSLGWLDGEAPVSGTIVVAAQGTAYYASGVYDRQQFEKPLAHFPLWQAILRGRERGDRWFDLGEIFARDRGSDKEINIDFFKRGFTSRRQLRLSWLVPVGVRKGQDV